MSNNKKLVPKRRFKNSLRENEWQLIRLGDQAVIKGRLGWKSLKQEEYVDNGPSMIAGKHITKGVINWYNVDHIPQWRYDESPEIMLRNDDIIFSKDGSLGNPALIEKLNCLATINSTMMLVRLKKSITPRFFYQIMLSNQFENLIRLKVSGSSIPHLFQADMTNFKFLAPKLIEQTQIGEFFKKLDDLIKTQQKKLEKTKTLKSAYLAEMFPTDGELKPKLRFKGFNNNWIYEKLGKVTKWSKGTNLAKDVLNKEGKGNSVIHYADLYKFAPVVDGVIHWSEIDEGHIIPQNSLLFPMSDVTPNGLARTTTIIKANVRASSDTLIATISNEISAEYLSYEINAHSKKILPLVTGTTLKHINANSLSTLLIKITEIGEQYKIAKLLNLIENYISLEQRKLDKLNNIKQAYLNEMFV